MIKKFKSACLRARTNYPKTGKSQNTSSLEDFGSETRRTKPKKHEDVIPFLLAMNAEKPRS